MFALPQVVGQPPGHFSVLRLTFREYVVQVFHFIRLKFPGVTLPMITYARLNVRRSDVNHRDYLAPVFLAVGKKLTELFYRSFGAKIHEYPTLGKTMHVSPLYRSIKAVTVRSVQPFLRIKRLHNRRDLPKEPVLRRLVRNINKLVILLSGLMGKPDTRVFGRHPLNVCEGQAPLQCQLSRPEGDNPGGGQKHDAVSSRDVSSTLSIFWW